MPDQVAKRVFAAFQRSNFTGTQMEKIPSVTTVNNQ